MGKVKSQAVRRKVGHFCVHRGLADAECPLATCGLGPGAVQQADLENLGTTA